MSDDHRREQFAAGCVARLRQLWQRVLRYLRVRTDSDAHTPPLPGISIENLIERHKAPVDDPGPGNGIPRVALEVVRSDTALSSIIAAGEIVVHRGQLDHSATIALLRRGRFR